MTIDPRNEQLLIHFRREVLLRYRAEPNRFRVWEDDNGGRLESLEAASSWSEVRFGHRRLADDRVCLAVFGPDFEKLPQEERTRWLPDLLPEPSFLLEDPAFQRWVERYLDSSWGTQAGPIERIVTSLRLLRVLTEESVHLPLFRIDEHPLVHYPLGENTEAYRKAHLELCRLVVDSLDGKVLELLAKRLGRTLTDPTKTLNALKELIPTALVATVHAPLKQCRDIRSEVHGSEPQPKAHPAFDSFRRDLNAVADALDALRRWIEDELGLDARACERKQEVLRFFPTLLAPPDPAVKLEQVSDLAGRTIADIQFGAVRRGADRYWAEALVFRFTDGSALAIEADCNVGSLTHKHPALRPDEVSTYLMPIASPSPRRAVRDDDLCALADRIGQLMQFLPSASVRDTLDTLLGVVYALLLAEELGYQNRTGPFPPDYWLGPLQRAADMGQGRLRKDGKWAAGFYFNSALLRTAAAFHRILKALTHKDGYVPTLRELVQPPFPRTNLDLVHDEVNSIKHAPDGLAAGRRVRFDEAVRAVDELVTLVESKKTDLAGP